MNIKLAQKAAISGNTDTILKTDDRESDVINAIYYVMKIIIMIVMNKR